MVKDRKKWIWLKVSMIDREGTLLFGDGRLHTWIMESAMNSSPNIYEDLVQNNGEIHMQHFCQLLVNIFIPLALIQDVKVIAKGTSESRVAAANLLLHYWPFPNPHIIHRRIIQYKVHGKCGFIVRFYGLLLLYVLCNI
uniref:RNase H domain-containing protein n=1 Tax=Angiostrongylus cantonensis TaxID=6313 RepID=A0A0K0D4F4_ANGCA